MNGVPEQIVLAELIQKELDGGLTDQEFGVLQSMLKKDAAAVNYYVKTILAISTFSAMSITPELESFGEDQESLLVLLAEYEKTSPAIKLPKEEPERELIQEVVYPKREKHKMSRFDKFIFVACAAVILFLVFLNVLPDDKSSCVDVATLVDQIDAQWIPSSKKLKNNERLWTDDGLRSLKKGIVKIQYDDGVDVLIEGPAVFELQRSGVYLEYGRLYSCVSEAGIGFKVETPSSQFIDMGTEFGIYAEINNSSELHVIKGKVQLLADSDNISKFSRVVTKNNAVQYDANSKIVKNIEFEENAFVRQINSTTGVVWRGPEAVAEHRPDDKFEWVPGEAGDTPALPVIETATPKATADTSQFTKRYVIELGRFDISNDGTNAAKTSAGINAALKYAAEADYNYIQFPEGTYLINPNDPIVLSFRNTIVDLNGATLQMQTNTNEDCTLISITYGAENLRLTNGTLKGDRYDRDYSTGETYGHVSTLEIKSGMQLEIDHMHFTESAGSCVRTQKGIDRLRDFGYYGVKAENLESGGFSENGQLVMIADTCRTSQPYDVSDYFGDEFEFGYVFGYCGYVSIFDRNYRALFFDSSMHFIEARNLLQFRKYSMPANTKYIHLQFSQLSAENGVEGMVGSLSNLRGPVDVHFHHNQIDNSHGVGFAFCGGQRWVIEDCVFEKNGGATPPHYGIVFEDGWDLMQDVVVRNNRFKDNHTGDVVVCAGSEMLFEGNEFEKYVYVKGRAHNYTFRKNRFLGGNVGFITRTGVATIERNTFKDVESISVEYDVNDEWGDGLDHLPGEVVPTPALMLRDCVLEDIPMFKGTYFNLSGGKLTNVNFRAGEDTRMATLNGCEIVNSSIFFEEDGPDVIYSVDGCSGDLQVTGPGIARQK